LELASDRSAPPNNRMKLTKRVSLKGWRAFARRGHQCALRSLSVCSADTTKAVVGSSPALLPLLTEQNRLCGSNKSGFALSPLKVVVHSSDLAFPRGWL
jgi:hypothetical protein